MWLFTKERTAFPYQVDATTDEHVGDWILRPCKNTKTGAACSAWVLDCTRDSGLQERGKTLIKRMKTLRHPNFITYLDSHEAADSVTLITEPAVPLSSYLRRSGDSGNLIYLTSWGLYQVAKGLDFFNKDVQLQHGNVRMDSVFVTPAGDWKLAGLDFVQPLSEAASAIRPPRADLYWPSDARRVDSWGLGCLIWEVYNSGGLSRAEQLRQFGNIPPALVPQYSELVHMKAARRTSISDFLSRACATTGFFDNFYVRSLLFLEEIQIKEKEEKLQFLAGLADQVTTFPDDVAKFKLLPHLLHLLQYGGAGAEVLTPLLRLSKLLDATQFEQTVLPSLVKLFSSPDRATRVRLLEALPSFVEHLPERCVNEQIFPPVAQGFTDSNPVVREATIRAMVPLSAKLSDRILNDSLPRSLTLLQVKDEQGGIRANASICLVKIAGRMAAKTRQGPLLNTFLKCTRDPYPAARKMAVVALATTLPFYTLRDTACKVLPCLAFLTVDPVKEVREETFTSLAAAVARLQRASDDATVAESEDQRANAGAASDSSNMAASAASAGSAALAWTNWAVSALSAKFAKSATTANEPQKGVEKPAKTADTPNAAPTAATEVEEKLERKPASSYDWDEEFHDALEPDGEWVGLESVGTKLKEQWNADDLFSQAGVKTEKVGGSRRAMKLGKKVERKAPEVETKRKESPADEWTNSWAGQDTAWAGDTKKERSSPTNDWGSGWDSKKTDRASPADDWGSGWDSKKTDRAAPADDWGSGWDSKKTDRASPADDWGSGWDSKKTDQASPANDWENSWATETKAGRGSGQQKARADEWDSWGKSESRGAGKTRKKKGSDDGWDAW